MELISQIISSSGQMPPGGGGGGHNPMLCILRLASPAWYADLTRWQGTHLVRASREKKWMVPCMLQAQSMGRPTPKGVKAREVMVAG